LAATLYRGASAFLAVYVVGSAISFGVQLFIARVLGAPSYGHLVYAMSWMAVLLLGCNFGLKPTAVRFVAAYNARSEWGSLRGFLRNSTWWTIAASMVVVTVSVTVLWLVRPRLDELGTTLVLIAVAIGVSFWRKADLEEDIAIAVVRSFVQLTIVGYVIKGIFDSDSLWLVVVLLAFMVLFGAWTARGRAKAVPHAFVPLLIALSTAAAVTLGLVLILNIFEPKPRFMVPVGGMVIGNAMTSAATAACWPFRAESSDRNRVVP
jgi:O-antigen/teichoic acid export membrane protein